ncbi:hypothetical protein K8R47_02035 [archaeon]|nr:hypothetical protein [archaeon]
MNNKILIILITLFLLPLASAFTVETFEQQQSVCPTSTILFTATVTGSGDFTTSLSGSASQFSTAVPTGFSLTESSRTIYIYVTPPSYTQPGIYNLNLIVTGNGQTQTIPFTININNCHPLQISGEAEKTTCSGNILQYEFTFNNPGNFQDIYNLELLGNAEEFLTLSQDSIMLNPSQSKTVFIYVNVPREAEGNYGFTLTAESQHNSESVNGVLNVQNCFDFTTTVTPEYLEICEHSLEGITIDVTNLGDSQDLFDLSLIGPAWANLENTNLLINAQQSQSTKAFLNPDYQTDGNYNLNLRVSSQGSGTSQTKNINIDIKKCYDLTLTIAEEEDKLCGSLSKLYQVLIKNTGQFQNDFFIESNQPFATLDENYITLNSQEEKIINLEVAPTEDLAQGYYDIIIVATTLDDSGIQASDVLITELISKEQCFKPTISADNADVFQDSSTTLPIIIENHGSQKVKYEIAVTGTASSFTQINPGIIEVFPGEAETVYAYIAPGSTSPGIYKASISVKLTDSTILETENINIQVKKSTTIIEKEEGFFTKFANWIKNLFKAKPQIPKVTEEGIILSSSAQFKYDNQIYNLTIQEIEEDFVTLSIDQIQTILLLEVGEEKELDLNQNEENDILIKLNAIANQAPQIALSKIIPIIEEPIEEIVEDEIPEEEEEIEEPEEIPENLTIEDPENETTTEEISEEEQQTFWQKYKYYIIIIVVILILIILFMYSQKIPELDEIQDIEDEVEEEPIEEEKVEDYDEFDEEPLKIGRWFIGLIILAIIIYLIYKFIDLSNIIPLFIVYKFFIIGGIIILIILLLIIKYWSSIIEFFEEEIEEEKPKKKTVKKTTKKKKTAKKK